jgi:hypothetical protein
MEEFSKHLLNSIMTLFLDQTNCHSRARPFDGPPNSEFITRPVENQGLKVSLMLIPKSDGLLPIEILKLEIVHSLKKQKLGIFNFTDINVALCDSNKNLAESLVFVNKFFVSAACLSPYVNFHNSKSLELDLLKRKYVLDFKVEYKISLELQKVTALRESPGSKSFIFKRVIENSSATMNALLIVHDNLHLTLDNLKNIEQAKTLQQISKGGCRGRFFSEDNEEDPVSKSPSFRKRTATKLTSDYEVKQSFDAKRSLIFLDTQHPLKPFRLLDEVIMDNLEEESIEDNSTIPKKEPCSRRLTRNLNASSFFTETNVSLLSKQNILETKDCGIDLNLDNFDDVPSTDNLYYMVAKLQRALRLSLSGNNSDLEYSSRTNTAPTKEQGERTRDSNLSSSRRPFLVFHN